MYFGVNCAAASLSAFLPTIIQTFGFSKEHIVRLFLTQLISLSFPLQANALAQLLSVPPYAVAAIILAMVSWATDRLKTRGIFVVFSSFVGAIGYV